MLVGLNIMKGIKIKNKISRPNISLAIHLRLVDSLLFSDILSSVFLRALDRDSFASVIWADRNFFDSFMVFLKSAVSLLSQFSKLVFSN